MDTAKPKKSAALSAAAIAALHHGNKIEAIKIVREELNIGLKDAKDAVDEYVRSHAALQSSLAAAQSETKQNMLLGLAALIVIALIAYYFVGKP